MSLTPIQKQALEVINAIEVASDAYDRADAILKEIPHSQRLPTAFCEPIIEEAVVNLLDLLLPSKELASYYLYERKPRYEMVNKVKHPLNTIKELEQYIIFCNENAEK